MSDVDFVEGMIVRPPVTKDGRPLPGFIKAKVSIKVADLIGFLKTVDDDWLNVDIKESKSGKWYAQVDNWKPDSDSPKKAEPAQAPAPVDDIDDDDIPF